MRFIAIILSAFLLLQTWGCSIYRMNIHQGNIVEQKDVDQIRKGMNRAQIHFILGQPLVNDTFDDNTWRYLNTFKNGKSGETTRKELLVYFVEDKVDRIAGDFKPSEEFSDTQ